MATDQRRGGHPPTHLHQHNGTGAPLAEPGHLPERNTSALATKSGNNKIIYQDILIAVANVINDLSVPCHEQRTGAATDWGLPPPEWRL